MRTKKYEYLVSYVHPNGHGTAFVTRDTTISSRDDIVAIERAIAENTKSDSIGVNGFQLLRTFKDKN